MRLINNEKGKIRPSLTGTLDIARNWGINSPLMGALPNEASPLLAWDQPWKTQKRRRRWRIEGVAGEVGREHYVPLCW